jgi:hypothetical protein
MAVKINELVSTIGVGARTNKYRVLFPLLGRDFDIQCNEFVSPGRSLGTSEVFLRGRKFLLAGDRADEGTFSITFYNDPDLQIRNFFLRLLALVQDYSTPVTVSSSIGEMDLFGRLQDAIGRLEGVYSEIKHNLNALLSLAGFDFLGAGTWYQMDISVQQLDENENTASTTVFHDAFVTDVSEIQYTDETGDISKTTVTFAFTGSTII